DRATPAKLALIHGHVALAATFASSLSPTEIAELARRAAFQVDVATILTLLDQGRSDLIAALPVAALSRSLELGHVELWRVLLESGLRGDEKEHMSLLMAAAAQSDGRFIEYFANAGLSLEARAEGGISALMIAAGLGRHDTVLALLRNGAQVDAIDAQGRTALHHAVLAGD